MNIIPRAEADRQHTNELAAAKNAIKRYSKLKLCRALKTAGLWDTVKAAIDASSYADEWDLAQDLSSTDDAFTAFMAALPGVSEEQKAALLAQCEED